MYLLKTKHYNIGTTKTRFKVCHFIVKNYFLPDKLFRNILNKNLNNRSKCNMSHLLMGQELKLLFKE